MVLNNDAMDRYKMYPAPDAEYIEESNGRYRPRRRGERMNGVSSSGWILLGAVAIFFVGTAAGAAYLMARSRSSAMVVPETVPLGPFMAATIPATIAEAADIVAALP
jgi:hypothetical protein